MRDELRPVSGNNITKYCGWAATLVDSLDTLWIMGLEEEFDNAVDAVSSMNFTRMDEVCVVNLFETTIRHLGGLMAAYDLGGVKGERLLSKALEIGEILYGAFQTYNGIPCNHFPFPR